MGWNSATVLNLASTELQDDREVVLHCVKIRGDAIKHASARLRGDKEIILAAARKMEWTPQCSTLPPPSFRMIGRSSLSA